MDCNFELGKTNGMLITEPLVKIGQNQQQIIKLALLFVNCIHKGNKMSFF